MDLLSRLDWTECEDLEFKAAKGGVPKSLWESYSALANSNGGVVLLGVEDNGNVCGVENTSKLKKSFWDTINNRSKVSLNLLTDVDVEEVRIEDKNILAIRIPRASRQQRPVYLDQNPLTGTYRRNYEGDYHCTEQEVGRMLSDRAEAPADSRILEGFGLKDLDRESLQQFRQRFGSHKPTHPWLSEDDIGLLSKLGGWRQDRKTEKEGLTIAGLLMFGREETITEALPDYHVDYREKFSDDPDVRYTDRLMMDGTWPPNLFQFYLRVVQRLSDDIKLPFQLDANLFRKGESVVHEAIREALVNALIHADYQGQGGIVIEKYRDRFVFSNPGMLLISLDQLLRGNVSECRNKSLQKMFTQLGLAERAGSGVDKIRRGWESQHWRSPTVRETVQPDRVEWVLPMVSLIPEESLSRLQKQFGKRFDGCTKQEVEVLVTADIEGGVDNARMRQITRLHASDVTQLLQKLTGEGFLQQQGQGRWTRYKLTPVTDFSHKDIHSVHKGDHSVRKGDHSVRKGDHSVGKDDHSVRIQEEVINKLATVFPDLDGGTLEQLYNLAEVSRSCKRLETKEMEGIILSICSEHWLTRSQIAALLNRNPDGLRQRFLTSMVRHGLLLLKYPDKPNRVDQAYRAAIKPKLNIRKNTLSVRKK
ncbi:MAG: putative DNA binding domain-containing protein [Verrucomicrobia bacterium]|nr:putative DNA binding domain-containing protein [Verrucomicrobiota bacterium]